MGLLYSNSPESAREMECHLQTSKKTKKGLFLGLYGRVHLNFQPVEKLFVELMERR